MSKDRLLITVEQAISCLNEGDSIHTFMNTASILMGCDISRDGIIKILNDHPDKIEIGGETSRRMKHGIVVTRSNGPLFIEADEEKIKQIESIYE